MRPNSGVLLVGVLAGIGACAGDDAKEDTGATETGATTETGDTNTTTEPVGFQLDAIAVDIATQGPAAAGLCVDLIDPSPALTGGDPVTMLSTTVGAGGAFSFPEVVTESVLGLLLSVKDCDAAGTVFTSATGVPAAAYDGLGAGDVLAGQTAYSISTPFLAGLQASAAAANYAGDLATEGLMFGFVFDAGGVPVPGATVTCDDCGPTFYMDADAADGLFTTGAAPNTATDAAANAAFLIPAAPINSYRADDGGAHTFEAQLNGSTPGSAVITAFYGI